MSRPKSVDTIADHAPSLCLAKRPDPIVLLKSLGHDRARAILEHAKKWANGTVIHYFFHEDEASYWSDEQKEAVHSAFSGWKDVGIGLEFVETAEASEAEVRIGFDQSDGSWSWVGTDVLGNDDRGRNMNFGWDLTTDWGKATALHEIGHMLGLHHGHLNPKAGIEWNEEAVYDHYASPPNEWDRDMVYWNIIRKLEPTEVTGSDWDPHSIMHYPIASGLIELPSEWQAGTPENTSLSNQDIAWARKFYPDGNAPLPIGVVDLQPLIAETGAQSDFRFEPEATRHYTVRTVGNADTKIVIFVERDGELRHFDAEDDSGSEANTEINAKFVRGENYVIRVRVHFSEAGSELGLLVF